MFTKLKHASCMRCGVERNYFHSHQMIDSHQRVLIGCQASVLVLYLAVTTVLTPKKPTGLVSNQNSISRVVPILHTNLVEACLLSYDDVYYVIPTQASFSRKKKDHIKFTDFTNGYLSFQPHYSRLLLTQTTSFERLIYLSISSRNTKGLATLSC